MCLLVPGMKFITNSTDSSSQALELVKCLWEEISESTHKDVLKLNSNPSNLLFDAAHSRNFKFLAVLIGSYPNLVHELDEEGRSIAVMHRHAETFKLIYLSLRFYLSKILASTAPLQRRWRQQ